MFAIEKNNISNEQYTLDSLRKNTVIQISQSGTCETDFLQDVTLKKQKSAGERKSSVLPGLTVTLADTEKRQCYFHFTVATDTGNIKTVFEDVHTMVLMSVLNDFGLQ